MPFSNQKRAYVRPGVHYSLFRGVLSLFTFVLVLGTSASVVARGLPPQEGILNFGKVSDHLYRGAQPDAAGIQALKKLGVKLIVNLRMPGDCWKEEANQAAANGILYTNFPMTGMGRPKDDQVQQLLALLASSPGPVYVHCQHGCDRTGTVVACYRIQHDNWSNDLALREAKLYGISRWEFNMRRFVRNFRAPLTPDLRRASLK